MRFTPRRRLCRATFCVLCLLPTLLVGGAALVVNTPGYRAKKTARWHGQLASRLGLEVAFAEVDWQAEDRLVVRALELCDPESHDWLARARSATIQRDDGGLVVQLGQAEINARRLPRLIAILHEHLLLRSDPASDPIQLFAPTLVLQAEPRAESLLEVRFALEVNSDGAEAFFQFQPAGTDDAQPVRVRVVRNRQLDPPATGWELHTGATALPCQLVQAWLPQVDDLGPSCVFQGSIWSERLSSGWEAEISGIFRQLDLDCLVTGKFPHKLSGNAELMLARMIVRRGQVVEVRGQLKSDGGVVSQSLLHAAEEHLRLKRYALSTDSMRFPYRDLLLEFSLDESGLVVAGHDDPSQAILSDSQGPVLTSQDAVRVPPQALVRLLVPSADSQVPATKETTALLQALPLPAVIPRDARNARRDYSPLKLIRK